MSRDPKGVRALAVWIRGVGGVGGAGDGGKSILAEGPACAKTLRQERPMWLKCTEHAWGEIKAAFCQEMPILEGLVL